MSDTPVKGSPVADHPVNGAERAGCSSAHVGGCRVTATNYADQKRGGEIAESQRLEPQIDLTNFVC